MTCKVINIIMLLNTAHQRTAAHCNARSHSEANLLVHIISDLYARHDYFHIQMLSYLCVLISD